MIGTTCACFPIFLGLLIFYCLHGDMYKFLYFLYMYIFIFTIIIYHYLWLLGYLSTLNK